MTCLSPSGTHAIWRVLCQSLVTGRLYSTEVARLVLVRWHSCYGGHADPLSLLHVPSVPASPGRARERGWLASSGHPAHLDVRCCISGRYSRGPGCETQSRVLYAQYHRSIYIFSPRFLISWSPNFMFAPLRLLTQPATHLSLLMGPHVPLTPIAFFSLQA